MRKRMVGSRDRNAVAWSGLLAAVLWTGLPVPPLTIGAQSPLPPVRQLGFAQAVSPDGLLSSLAALRGLSDGSVLVNDVTQRRVLLLDSSLQLRRVVADTTSATQRIYGTQATGLFAFGGDSSLFVDGATLSMAVVDSAGRVARVTGPPRVDDLGQLVGGAAGNPGLDARGRLVYRLAGPTRQELLSRGQLGGAAPPESAAVVRFDFTTRRLDTAAYVRIYSTRIVAESEQTANGITTWMSPVLNPAPVVDDWAILSTGTIAIVRGQDYHVDLVDSDNRLVSAPKLPFAWRRLSDADKAALIDASKALRERLISEGVNVAYGVAPLPSVDVTSNQRLVVTSNRGPVSVGEQAGRSPAVRYASSDELPDYMPVFATGAVRADADGRLWVRTITTDQVNGGAIYHVITRTGRLLDRVQVPRNGTIAGFAPGGRIFLAQRDGARITLLRFQYDAPPTGQ